MGSWLPGVKRADIFDSDWGKTPLDRTDMQFGGCPIFEAPVGRAGGSHRPFDGVPFLAWKALLTVMP